MDHEIQAGAITLAGVIEIVKVHVVVVVVVVVSNLYSHVVVVVVVVVAVVSNLYSHDSQWPIRDNSERKEKE